MIYTPFIDKVEITESHVHPDNSSVLPIITTFYTVPHDGYISYKDVQVTSGSGTANVKIVRIFDGATQVRLLAKLDIVFVKAGYTLEFESEKQFYGDNPTITLTTSFIRVE